MKFFTLFLFAFIASAQANDLTLSDVVVLKDSMEGDFYDTAFIEMLGYVNPIAMADSCQKIQVRGTKVECSSAGNKTAVGTLAEVRGNDEGSIIYSVNWNDKIQIQRKTLANGRRVFQLGLRGR